MALETTSTTHQHKTNNFFLIFSSRFPYFSVLPISDRLNWLFASFYCTVCIFYQRRYALQLWL